jgi:hypothetical protein
MKNCFVQIFFLKKTRGAYFFSLGFFCKVFWDMSSKQEIYDFWFRPQPTSRSGGGKLHTSMQAVRGISLEAQQKFEQSITDPKLKQYYDKLRLRDKDKLAPPPRPQN